jgi:hypothetical protein
MAIAGQGWWRTGAVAAAMAVATAVTVGIVAARAPRSSGDAGAIVAGATPTPATIEACNRQAAAQVSGRPPATAPAAASAAEIPYGVDELHRHDPRFRDAYAACIKSWGYGG